ncbi:MAG: hypothetical protein ACJ8R9_25520 [Steroidobacteraceae bacterium]
MIRYSRALLALWLVVGSGGILAQGPPPDGGVNAARVPEGITLGYMSQGDVKGLADFVDSTRLLEPKGLVSKAVAAKHTTAMLNALQISCQLTDARHIAAGKSMEGGKPVEVALYEAACANGMGYLLTMRDLSLASGISCLAASAAPADNKEAAKVDLKCQLPANGKLDDMAATVMRNAGTNCAANKVRWLGESAEPKLDYTDVACNEDQEFILRTPVPGSAGNIDVLTCKDAALHGAKCQLTAAGSAAVETKGAAAPMSAEQARPTLQWFKDALGKNGVACDVKKARIVGRESIKRRYIVEYQCPQQPHGVVAYVPSVGDVVNPFEWIDCEAAASRKLACQFTAEK